MSVYTPVSPAQISLFLDGYSLGSLIDFSGIQAGIENTNYKVNTTKGQFILTLYETLTETEIPIFLQLLQQLNQQDFLVPKPQENKQHQLLNYLNSKPAAIFNCLPGQSVHLPTIAQCTKIGAILARLHQCEHHPIKHKNPSNLSGFQAQFNLIKSSLNMLDRVLIEDELQYQENRMDRYLPKGLIHADLFKDNVLFYQGGISGVLDFYNACQGVFVFDIAVAINDWCCDNGEGDTAKIKGLLLGYQSIRTLEAKERQALPDYLRLTALRFWLSRLVHQQQEKTGELMLIKDPLVFRRTLQYHRLQVDL